MAECIYEDEAQDPADTLTMDRLLPQLPLRLHWFETGYTGSMPPTLILADPSGKRNMLVVYIVGQFEMKEANQALKEASSL